MRAGRRLGGAGYTPWIFPAAISLLAGFVAFTYWSSKARGAADCGCYGQWLSLSPAESIRLDCAYALLLGIAWAFPVSYGFARATQHAIVSEAAVIGACVIFMSYWAFSKAGRDLLDLSPLKVNQPWNPNWISDFAGRGPGASELIVLMSPTCSVCKDWTQPLNKISRREDMPGVTAVMALPEEEIKRLISAHGVEFPVRRIGESLMNRLVMAFPTVVELEGGIVRSKLEWALPAHLLTRLRQLNLEQVRAAVSPKRT